MISSKEAVDFYECQSGIALFLAKDNSTTIVWQKGDHATFPRLLDAVNHLQKKNYIGPAEADAIKFQFEI